MRRIGNALLLSAACTCAALGGDLRPSYGPDALVDVQPSAWYVEPAIAVSPVDARQLIAGSMVFAAGGITAETFRSEDGGYGWRPTLLPVGSGSLLGDVQAAFDASGRAYVTVLGSERAPSGATVNGLFVFASRDAGQSFQRVAFLQTPDKHDYDHEQLAVDCTTGRYRGRVYMTALYTVTEKPQVNGLGLLWSADGGRTFYGPVRVWTGWSFNSKPVVLADGTVLFPFFHVKTFDDVNEAIAVASSRDGGHTFTAPVSVGTRTVLNEKDVEARYARSDYAFDADSVPQFAAGRSGRGKDVYAVWSDLRSGTSRLLYVRSSDAGKHWSVPRELFTPADASDAQYQPSITVNADGTLAMSWYGASHAGRTVSEMFSVSGDGGQTFSPPVQISSVSAPFAPAASDGYTAQAFPDSRGIFVGLTSPRERFPSFGDYMGLASDSSGAFHPIWIDARYGVAQVWTATVFPTPPAPRPANLVSRAVTGQVSLEFGIGTWDVADRTFSVPVRLHNTSKQVLFPPYTVRVTMTTDPDDPRPQPPVEIANADNGKTGIGAEFQYPASSTGNLGRLLPGAETASRVWQLRVPSHLFNPLVLTSVSAYEPPAPSPGH